MSKISTHVLDTALGRPAPDLTVRLERIEDGVARLLSVQQTSRDGRIADLLQDTPLAAATYRLSFDTGAYFARSGRASLYPRVEIVFEVSAPGEHHHIPLLLSPYGYSTYRGS